MKWIFAFLLITSIQYSCKNADHQKIEAIDYKSISTYNQHGNTNMIVEIPSGTTAKNELDKITNTILIDSINGSPRYIDYLGYPGNYGLIPNTMLSKEDGGDGDPLDILLLGSSKELGSIQPTRIVGVLKILDSGEHDDKIIAVPPNSNWDKVKSVRDLDLKYPGAIQIIETFFKNYKKGDQMRILGWGDTEEALSILSAASSETQKSTNN